MGIKLFLYMLTTSTTSDAASFVFVSGGPLNLQVALLKNPLGNKNGVEHPWKTGIGSAVHDCLHHFARLDLPGGDSYCPPQIFALPETTPLGKYLPVSWFLTRLHLIVNILTIIPKKSCIFFLFASLLLLRPV